MELKNYFEHIIAQRKIKKELKEKEKIEKEKAKKLILHNLCEQIKQKLSFLEEYDCSIKIDTYDDKEYVEVYVNNNSAVYWLFPCMRMNGNTDTKYDFYDKVPWNCSKIYHTYESLLNNIAIYVDI